MLNIRLLSNTYKNVSEIDKFLENHKLSKLTQKEIDVSIN